MRIHGQPLMPGIFCWKQRIWGINVPNLMMNRWIKFQQRKAKNWTETTDERGYYRSNNKLIQAYRLYTLSLAGKA